MTPLCSEGGVERAGFEGAVELVDPVEPVVQSATYVHSAGVDGGVQPVPTQAVCGWMFL